MYRLKLNTPTASSQVLLGTGILADGERLAHECRALGASRTVVVSNPTVMACLKDTITLPQHDLILIEDGEQHKNWRTLNHIYDALLEKGCGRDTLMLALGGGVVGDIAGFAAATYQRGIPLAQLPTTLLAQVDSSIGGKTAINHPLGKNMIGVFNQPQLVLIDPTTLATLPQREITAGFAEVVKYALIGDAPFAQWLQHNADTLIERNSEALLHAIYTSCNHKRALVVQDEHEHGQRALLNLGHTFGHAIEKHVAYQGWIHGEAVGLGLRIAADFSLAIGWLNADDHLRVGQLCDSFDFPRQLPVGLDAQSMTKIMLLDKKNRAGSIRLILLHSIGHAAICTDLSTDDITCHLRSILPKYQ